MIGRRFMFMLVRTAVCLGARKDGLVRTILTMKYAFHQRYMSFQCVIYEMMFEIGLIDLL